MAPKIMQGRTAQLSGESPGSHSCPPRPLPSAVPRPPTSSPPGCLPLRSAPQLSPPRSSPQRGLGLRGDVQETGRLHSPRTRPPRRGFQLCLGASLPLPALGLPPPASAGGVLQCGLRLVLGGYPEPCPVVHAARCRRRTKAEPRGPGGSSVGARSVSPGRPRTCAPSCPAALYAARQTSAEVGVRRARPSPSDRRAPGSRTRSRLHLDRRRRERRPGRTPSRRPGPGSQPAAGAVSTAGPSPGFLGPVGVAPSSPRGPDKMEDVVSSLSHDGSGGRLPTGLRRGEAPPALGARGAPPPAFQTSAPAPFAEAPALPALTGLPDTGQGGLGGHRGRGAPEEAALVAVARAGGPDQVFGPPGPDSAQPQGPSRGRCCGNRSRRPDPDGPGHGGGGEGGGMEWRRGGVVCG
ncbi:hypothetical protein R6Z07M_009986 [Ovis aries]